MQKIFSVGQIREADQYTIQNEPIASIDLMERAAQACVRWMIQRIDKTQTLTVFCGPGNNGGDGLAIARLMSEAEYSVRVFYLDAARYSDDFIENKKRLELQTKFALVPMTSADNLPEISPDEVIVDALFGSGLSKPMQGLSAQWVKQMNQLPNIKIAIDIPSGLYADVEVEEKSPIVFQANYTLSFQFPKLAFLLPQNDAFVGSWQVLDIGLSQTYIQNTVTSFYLVEGRSLKAMLKLRPKFAHKGSFGHALLIAGSLGKMGAAVLAGKAALRSGAGLVTVHHPKSGISIVPTAVSELMTSIDVSEEVFSALPDLSKYNALAVGPGLGTAKSTQTALKLLIQQTQLPLILDADALNILAENKTWLSFLPAQSILTPHVKEFERLVGKSKNDFDQLQKQIDFAKKYQVYLILKGAHTRIATPGGQVFFNSSGNPGMATGGSGDVLTGILLGLKAQNYSALETCILGVFLHGLAGDIVAEKMGQASLIAGDIVEALGDAFRAIEYELRTNA